jgi:F1F0 ATPase subunit 2
VTENDGLSAIGAASGSLFPLADSLTITASFVGGALLALAFFWGLWITVAGLPQAPRPAARLLFSGLLRLGMILLVFYLVARYGDWRQLPAAAVGFVTMRLVVVRMITRRASRGGSAP